MKPLRRKDHLARAELRRNISSPIATDAFVLPDGQLAMVIGDVSGHDLRAATIMGQVRNAVRAYAMLDPTPGVVLQNTNALLRTARAACRHHDLQRLRPETCTLTWSRAGHPPPLLRHDDTVTALEQPTGPMLGDVSAAAPYPHATVDLVPGDTLLLYTDGLIEQHGSDIAAADTQLHHLLAPPPPPPPPAPTTSSRTSTAP